MGYQTPKIAQDVRRLRWEIEKAVRAFPKFHRYSSGSGLRDQVKVVQLAINDVASTDKEDVLLKAGIRISRLMKVTSSHPPKVPALC